MFVRSHMRLMVTGAEMLLAVVNDESLPLVRRYHAAGLLDIIISMKETLLRDMWMGLSDLDDAGVDLAVCRDN